MWNPKGNDLIRFVARENEDEMTVMICQKKIETAAKSGQKWENIRGKRLVSDGDNGRIHFEELTSLENSANSPV